jgi:tetratricopeptide (TPR) repeat protein
MKKENRRHRTSNAERRTPNCLTWVLGIACWALGVFCFGLVLLLVLVIDPSARAQTIDLKTGQKVETTGVRREGDMIMGKVQVGSGSGEVGYHIPQIAKVEFPKPRGLADASNLLSQGQPDKALAEIDQVVTYYDPFKDVPGAWWSQAALIKVSALSALHRDTEAEALVAEIQRFVTDPETARGAQLQLTTDLIRKQDFEKAAKICDTVIKESAQPEILAEAWIKRGDLLYAQRRWDEALLAYLHVPVFYSDEKRFMPPALLGSARAYGQLDDDGRARKSLNELIATFPKSAEAAIAKTEIEKMEK